MSENTKVEAKRVFIGAGCNRVVNNVSWGASGLVSFGAQNAVAVFCPKTAQILTTLPGHKASVNCTHWLPTSKFAFKAKKLDRQYLLSGDSDGIIILWELSTLNNDVKFPYSRSDLSFFAVSLLSLIPSMFSVCFSNSGDMYYNYHCLTRKV
jgi:WD40 repeat protein